MGNKQAQTTEPSKLILSEEDIKKKQKPSAIDVQCAHYTPPSFPLTPIVTKKGMELCKTSWKKILEPVERNGMSLSGMTVFFTEFYDTLEHFDKLGKFETVLRQHTSGMNGIAAKGAILIRII